MGCCSDRLKPRFEKSITGSSTEPEIEEGAYSLATPSKKHSHGSKKRLEKLISSRSSRRIKLTKSKSANYSGKTYQNESPVQVKAFIKTPIREKFTTIKKLYNGLIGEISLAADKKTGLKQIIKEIKKSSISIDIQEKFISETQKFLSIDHPNIVKLKEVYESGKSWLLVYEYLSGGSLLENLNKERIGYSSAHSIIQDILNGLNYCHQNGIHHLGLNLEKVIANSRNGKINKIIGFTFSWELEDLVKVNDAVSCYLAPEVLNGNYTQSASDIWSLGVMLYSIVQGKPPFRGKNLIDLKMEYERGIDYDENEWIFTSNEFDDLLRKMLEYDYKKRISAKDALNHPWIKNSQTLISTPENNKAIENILKFACKNKIAREFFIKAVFVDQYDNYQLIELYKNLDTDKDEKIGKEEFLSETQNLDAMTEQRLKNTFNSSDFFEKGYIGYSEFMAACTDWDAEENAQKIEKVFKNCDLSENGQLSVRNLKVSFERISNKEWANFFKIVDSDDSGKISFEELKQFLFSVDHSIE